MVGWWLNNTAPQFRADSFFTCLPPSSSTIVHSFQSSSLQTRPFKQSSFFSTGKLTSSSSNYSNELIQSSEQDHNREDEMVWRWVISSLQFNCWTEAWVLINCTQRQQNNRIGSCHDSYRWQSVCSQWQTVDYFFHHLMNLGRDEITKSNVQKRWQWIGI